MRDFFNRDFTLYDYLEFSFFTADMESYRPRNRKDIVELTKRIISTVVIGRAKLDDL
jgi:hypothetical protein